MFDEAKTHFEKAGNIDPNFQQAVTAKAMAAEQSKTFDQFEADLTASSEEGDLDGNMGRFQRSSLSLNGFIRNPNLLDRYGNTPDAPIRIVETVGTVIVRGYLDAEP
jgi:hypothetical protein